MSTFVVKVEYNGILRRFTTPLKQSGELDIRFDALKAKIINLFEIPHDAKLSLTYLDEDGDIVTLANEEDLRDVITQDLKFLKIRVLLNCTNQPKPIDATVPDFSPYLNAVPDSIKDSINQIISKILIELPSKASSSSQIATELCDSISKVGLNFLKNIPNNTSCEAPSRSKETTSDSANATVSGHSSCETPKPQNFDTCPFFGVPLERSPIPSKPTERTYHTGIVCDECDANPIIGVRYKSQIVPDFDLCETCFSKMGDPTNYEKIATPIQKCPFKKYHSNSYLVAPNPSVGPCHVGVTCDGCKSHPIIGTRYKSQLKFDYDLCESCFSKTSDPTNYDKFETPIPRHQFGHSKSFQYTHFPIPPPAQLRRPGKPKLDSRFITDVNILDGTVISPGTFFTKIWRLRNNGTIRWPRGTSLMWIGGDKLANTDSVPLEIPDLGLPIEKEIDIAVDFSAPLLPGRYISYWRLVSPFGVKFGQRVWVLIQVDATADVLKNSTPNLNAVTEGNPVNETNADLVSYPKVEIEPVRTIEGTDPGLKELGFKEVDPNSDADEKKWASILEELFQMGFTDKKGNLDLLRKHSGSITAVVMDIINDEGNR